MSMARLSMTGTARRVGTVAAVTQWSIGDIQITRIDASNFVLPSSSPMPAWSVPAFTPSAGDSPIAFSALVIRAGSATVVVDPWIVDDSPRSRPDAADVIGGLLAELARLGVAAADVDFVVNTHIDGIGWNTRPSGDDWGPTFPKARYLFPADELAAVDRGVPINGSENLGPLVEAGVIEAVDPPFEIAPGVTLTAAPGHNYGHVAVRIEQNDQLAIYPGHLVLSLAQVDQPDGDLGDTDHAVASASRRLILGELAERRGILLTTLIGGPGGGIVEPLGAGYRLSPVGAGEH
jgi:glyoxylase-like metal-dependent hydrolase (beta-lactamase superfamily II)